MRSTDSDSDFPSDCLPAPLAPLYLLKTFQIGGAVSIPPEVPAPNLYICPKQAYILTS
jgi:hypothetical protein